MPGFGASVGALVLVAGAGHGAPTGGGELMPALFVVGAAVILGSALVVVLIMGRDRRRRDLADPSGRTERES